MKNSQHPSVANTFLVCMELVNLILDGCTFQKKFLLELSPSAVTHMTFTPSISKRLTASHTIG